MTEEAILTRWEKLKQWFEIAMATKKLVMFVWVLIFGVTGTMAVGKITNTNPLRDGAIEIGLVDPTPIDTTKGMLQEELINQLATVQQEINELKEPHEHNYPKVITGPAGKDGINGKDGKDGVDTASTIAATQIDDAFSRHKLDDH